MAVRQQSFIGSLIFLLFSFPLFALDVPPKPDGYVTDRAGLLSPPTKERLESELAQYEKETTNQIVVATFESLEKESLEDFSIRLAQSWKIGQKDRNNGVILLIFPKDRKMRIEVGYGMEGALTDATASQIIRDVMTPRFREGDFEGGILQGVQTIMEAVRGEYTAAAETPKSGGGEFFFLIVIMIFVLFVADSIRYGVYKKGHRSHSSRYGFLEWWFRFAILCFLLQIILRILLSFASSSGRAGGSGGFSSGGGSSSGGGFSGGGGSFGGGGASGSW